MPNFVATTTVSILRGTASDRYGDTVDTDAVVKTGLPASILERPVTSTKPAEGREDTPRTYAMRTRWRGLQQNDRIRDERTGTVYAVTTLAPQTNPVGHAVVRADLQRVT